MKKILKRLSTIVLAVIMLIAVVPLTGLKSLSDLFPKAEAVAYGNGDIIEFGSYPQSEVKDEETLSALNSISAEWKSYGYYSGNGFTGSMTQGDWMKYCDVEYNGEKYRGVYFTKYRPDSTYYSNSFSSISSNQNDNGYYTNTYYWFKYEPLKWRILEPNEGLVLSENLIDSQPYQNSIYGFYPNYYNNSEQTVYANDYETSSIRKWLNDDFYNIAFSFAEKIKIQTTKLDNSAYSEQSKYDSKSTNDKIFLMSWNEILNAHYGFDSDSSNNNSARWAKSTDYAKSQGIYVENKVKEHIGNGSWLLRSSGYYPAESCSVKSDGHMCFDSASLSADTAFAGIRPAFKFDSESNPLKQEPAYTLGDVDGDGKITSYDAYLCIRAAVKLGEIESAASRLAADFDRNGKIMSNDARLILRYALELDGK